MLLFSSWYFKPPIVIIIELVLISEICLTDYDEMVDRLIYGKRGGFLDLRQRALKMLCSEKNCPRHCNLAEKGLVLSG